MDFKSVVEQSQYCRKQLRELIDSYYTVYEKDSSNQDKKIIIIRLRCLYLSYRRLLDSMDLHRYLSDECFLKKDMQFEYNSSSYEESKFEVIFHSFYTNITLAINQLRYLNNKFKENKEIQQIRVKHRKSIANIVRIRNLMTAHPMSEKLGIDDNQSEFLDSSGRKSMVNGRVHKKTYTLINLKKPNLIKELKLEPLVDLRLLNDYIIDLLPGYHEILLNSISN